MELTRHFSPLIALPRRRKLATTLVRRNDFIRHCKLWAHRDGNGTVPQRTTSLACPHSGGATEHAAQSASKIFLSAVRRTKSPRTGDARCMGYVGHLLFELTLALAAR